MPRGSKAACLQAAEASLSGLPRDVLQKKLAPGKTYLVHLSLVSQETIRALNRQYRKKNKVTDVLSFSRLEGPETPHPEVGDVLICPARAREQAELWGNSFLEELSRLTVHGMLHLFGYDHERSAKDERLMFRLQDHILFSMLK
jgi:probable rRNA maturation factor